MKTKNIIICLLILMAAHIQAQEKPITLTLDQTIALAADSSLQAFRNKSIFLSGYWQYRTYKANRLPSLSLGLTPAQYNRQITMRYDSEKDIDVYRPQQIFSTGANISITQNFDLLGGSFYIDSDLGYMRYFGENTSNQFTAIPIRIGYSQSLLGYNPFRWERKIEPLKYEKTKKQFLYDRETVSGTATAYFFNLAMAQASYDIAEKKVYNYEDLYRTGEERYKIASINKGELMTLKLDVVNARNELKNAEIDLQRATFSLASFLNFDKNTKITLTLPNRPRNIEISIDEAIVHARENNPTYLEQQQTILEAEQLVDKTRKESLFNARFSASIGFNQTAENFKNVYRNPSQQDIVSLSLSIPLIDWGVRKGRYNMAKNQLNVSQISVRQEELSLEEDVIMTIREFNVQQDLISSAEEALELAEMAFEETRQRFMIGTADVNSLNLAQTRQDSAQRNYVTALRSYWESYYKIRKITLYDFDLGFSLSNEFDYEYHIK